MKHVAALVSAPQVRPIRSFVRRPGRMTPGQKKALSERMSQYTLPKAIPTLPQGPLILEIGFGRGDTLFQAACFRPNDHFIGVEVHMAGVGALLNKVVEKGLNNVHVIVADAIEVLEQGIPPESLHEVWLFFPDPWPKKRHHKRRIVNAAFAQLVMSRLKQGGKFHLATDWEPYAEHMREVLEQTEGLVNMAGKGQFIPRPQDRAITKFEMRGEGLGHGIFDLIYLKGKNDAP